MPARGQGLPPRRRWHHDRCAPDSRRPAATLKPAELGQKRTSSVTTGTPAPWVLPRARCPATSAALFGPTVEEVLRQESFNGVVVATTSCRSKPDLPVIADLLLNFLAPGTPTKLCATMVRSRPAAAIGALMWHCFGRREHPAFLRWWTQGMVALAARSR